MNDLREWLLDRIDGGEEMRGEDGLVSNFIRQIDAQDAELADLKQRLLPQFQGRTQRAEHERDALLEELIVRRTTIANLHDVIHRMRKSAPSATAAPSDIVKRIVEGGATRILFKADGYCPSCGHNRNISSVSSIYMGEGKHACQLCGTGWLEIKRRDMKGEPVECGYDRTASLNAGHYVCLCGGACSSPTTREQP